MIQEYFGQLCSEISAIPAELQAFEATFADLKEKFAAFADSVKDLDVLTNEQRQPLVDALEELTDAIGAYETDRTGMLTALTAFLKEHGATPPATNAGQHIARQAFDPLADRVRGLVKQVDLLYKLAARVGQMAQELIGVAKEVGEFHDRRAVTKLIKQLEEERKQAVEQLKQTTYVHRQIHWLQERFPNAEMVAVPGLCKVVDRAVIEAADWSLTPGRYVGVAPAEVDEGFDFEQTLKDIHLELVDLNREAVELAEKIQENIEGLGI